MSKARSGSPLKFPQPGWLLLFLLAHGGLLSAAGGGNSEFEKQQFDEKFNQTGLQYLEQGRLKEAVEQFEKAYQINSKDKVIESNLITAYNNYAVSLFDAGKPKEAKFLLDKGLRIRPHDHILRKNLSMVSGELEQTSADLNAGAETAPLAGMRDLFQWGGKLSKDELAVQHLKQGAKYYQEKNYVEAKEHLQESLKYEQRNPLAYEILGDIAYLEQDLKKAEEYYETSYKGAAVQRVQEKIEKLKKERVIEEQLDPYSAEHFIIRYQEERDQYSGGYEIRELLREAYEVIGRDLGRFLVEKVPVIFYTEEQYRAISETPHWSAALFDGKIRLPAYKERMNMAEVKRLVWHELTHAYVLDISRGHCPLWLNEGLAQFEENRIKKIDVNAFKSAWKKKSILSIAQLSQGTAILEKDTGVVTLFYQQSFLITQYLIERYRWEKVREMLQGLSQGRSFEEALKGAVQISVATLEKQWLEDWSQRGASA